MTPEQDAAYNALGHALRLNLTVAQVRWELEISRKHLLEAIEAATARGLDGSLYGEAGLHSFHESEHVGWITRWRQERGY
jgi:hypothetical protein